MKLQRTTKAEKTAYKKPVKLTILETTHYLTMDNLKEIAKDAQSIIENDQERERLVQLRKHLYDSLGDDILTESRIDEYLEGK